MASRPQDSTMQRIVLAARPQGEPKHADFRLETEPVPAPGIGEALVRVIWLSLDPYMRGRMDDVKSYAEPVQIGSTMEAGCVGEVVTSDDPALPPGSFVEGRFGWTTHAIVRTKGLRRLDPATAPLSSALGVLGMPGMTAWTGLHTHGRAKAGETIVVSAATGAVGSVVGQLARIAGLRVVGVAGGADKCRHAVEKLGYDACLDHRDAADARELRTALAAACPDGVDIYFENVGGKTLEAVMPLMNVGGRIPLCGVISWYNSGGLGQGASEGPNLLPTAWRHILVKRLTVRGFIVTDHWADFPRFLDEVTPLVAAGKIIYPQTVSEGLASAPEAFIGMLRGKNLGKQLVRVSPDPTA